MREEGGRSGRDDGPLGEALDLIEAAGGMEEDRGWRRRRMELRGGEEEEEKKEMERRRRIELGAARSSCIA